MKAIIDRILNNRMEDLKGLSIEGSIPLTEDLINKLLNSFLYRTTTEDNKPPSDNSLADGDINVQQLLEGLDVKDLNIELNDKAATLKLNLKKY